MALPFFATTVELAARPPTEIELKTRTPRPTADQAAKKSGVPQVPSDVELRLITGGPKRILEKRYSVLLTSRVHIYDPSEGRRVPGPGEDLAKLRRSQVTRFAPDLYFLTTLEEAHFVSYADGHWYAQKATFY